MKAVVKRMLRPFYRAARKALAPVGRRVRGPLSRLLYPPEFEAVFRDLESITGNLKSYLDQTDQLLLAMFRTMHLPPPTAAPALAAVPLGDGRVLAPHPAAPLILLDAGDLRETTRILTNRFEPGVATALQQLIRPGQTCLDLGASIGFHTLTLAHAVGAGGIVHAFEPDPGKAALLRDNLTANELAGRVRILEELPEALAALGGADVVRVAAGTVDSLANVARTRAKFLLPTPAGLTFARQRAEAGDSFWLIRSEGALYRAGLDEIEECGRQGETFFLAARQLD
jgi:hypothetical protein